MLEDRPPLVQFHLVVVVSLVVAVVAVAAVVILHHYPLPQLPLSSCFFLHVSGPQDFWTYCFSLRLLAFHR